MYAKLRGVSPARSEGFFPGSHETGHGGSGTPRPTRFRSGLKEAEAKPPVWGGIFVTDAAWVRLPRVSSRLFYEIGRQKQAAMPCGCIRAVGCPESCSRAAGGTQASRPCEAVIRASQLAFPAAIDMKTFADGGFFLDLADSLDQNDKEPAGVARCNLAGCVPGLRPVDFRHGSTLFSKGQRHGQAEIDVAQNEFS